MTGDMGNHDMDLPFEEQQPTPMNPNDVPLVASGVVVMATLADVPGVGLKPGLVFRLVRPDGAFYQPIMYVADDDQLAKMRPLINAAIASARNAAATTNREDLPAAFKPEPAIGECPECGQGKHQNCTLVVPLGDGVVDCPCLTRGHA